MHTESILLIEVQHLDQPTWSIKHINYVNQEALPDETTYIVLLHSLFYPPLIPEVTVTWSITVHTHYTLILCPNTH